MPRIVKLAAALLATASFALGGAATRAGADPMVYLRPLCLDILAGQTVTVHLSVGATGDQISCFYAVISYDPARIAILNVTEGNLFTGSPEPTFPGWQFTAPDSFEVYNCVLGSGTFVMPPGDLADITVQGLVSGPAPMTIGFIDIRNVARLPYPNITVLNCGMTGVPEEIEAPAVVPELRVTPNPAPGFARIAVLGTVPPGPVAIYDVAGRLCRALEAAGSGSVLEWDGRDASGRLAAPGLYVLRGGRDGELRTKLLLVR